MQGTGIIYYKLTHCLSGWKIYCYVGPIKLEEFQYFEMIVILK